MEQQCELYHKDCNCPVKINKFGRLEKFHESADEITDAILSKVKEPREI